MNRDVTHLMVDEFRQDRIARVSNGKGGWREEHVPLRTVRGRLNPFAWKDRLYVGQDRARVDHVLYIPPRTDVKINDHFVFANRTFRVEIPNIEPSIAVYQKVGLEEIQKATDGSN